ncbi:UDP-hexose transferase [Devosia geojensis]|uniref:UDP-hexose transferase n=1 Tax=Devosia geojensis TaxID=443610 RepID=A0A0F5FFG6_9HYPH|nr:glycosyltransferase family 2 protein [Devosia geojensis]KKB06947.1 UDP-hexose transferase [Devosia geojensis]
MQASVTIAVPSLNQAPYLDAALRSIFDQEVACEVYVMDGGSTDGTLDVIRSWEGRLAGWHSGPDGGQSDAINRGIASGTAPYVTWLNSDDLLLEGALPRLLDALARQPEAPACYGRTYDLDEATGERKATWVEPFAEDRLALRCIISQPGTLIRRPVWEAVGGLDPALHMAMDYDLWWRIYRRFGAPQFVDAFVAVNRVHGQTKTSTRRRAHYREAMAVVRRHYGRVPIKWWLAQPYQIWFRSGFREL